MGAMSSRSFFFCTVLAACLALAVPAHAAGVASIARASNLVPHKALYDIRLAGIKNGSQIVNISGQMLYEWQPSCGEGWTSDHRFNLSYEYADTPSMRVLSDFSTFESADGKSLDFTSQRKKDGALLEEFRGRATLDEAGAGKAVYTIPSNTEFDLPQGSLFPTAHTLQVLDNAKQGKKFFRAVVYDGADDEGPVEINAFIGKNVTDDFKDNKNIDTKLLQDPAHRVRLAFFPLKDDSATSDYEMTISLHDNGIISDMFIEYDDFSITQKLVALEPLKAACAASEIKP